jgi:hypothetical protein
VQHFSGRDPADPHHRGRGVADDASRAAGVGGGDDRDEVSDPDPAAEQRLRRRAADQRGRDVVEERRRDEHDAEQHECTGPVIGQERRQGARQAALLEVPGQDREADEQQREVRENHPFAREVRRQTVEPLARWESW